MGDHRVSIRDEASKYEWMEKGKCQRAILCTATGGADK